jgi:hypothetical protein
VPAKGRLPTLIQFRKVPDMLWLPVSAVPTSACVTKASQREDRRRGSICGDNNRQADFILYPLGHGGQGSSYECPRATLFSDVS